MMANVSIGALFLGGVIPGAVMTLFMMLYVYYCARSYNMGRDQAFRWKVLALTFVAAFPALLTPAIIIGGMTFGWFTPTEAAIAACAWAMILGIFLYRTLSLKQFYKVTMDTIETTAGVLLIVGAASLFGWVLTTTRVTEYTTEALLAITDNRYVILLLANVVLLVVGCFLEPIASISILVPVLMPVIAEGRNRSGALRRGDDAQPDDRAACTRRSAWCCSCWRASPSSRWSGPPWRSCHGSFRCCSR